MASGTSEGSRGRVFQSAWERVEKKDVIDQFSDLRYILKLFWLWVTEAYPFDTQHSAYQKVQIMQYNYLSLMNLTDGSQAPLMEKVSPSPGRQKPHSLPPGRPITQKVVEKGVPG